MTPEDRRRDQPGPPAPTPEPLAPEATGSRRFRPAERIRRRQDYERVYEHGARLSSALMTMFLAPNALGLARLGIAATRKIGPAVGRNRAKRRVREIFRHNRPAEAFDIVVVARRELIAAPFGRIEAEFKGLLSRHRRRSRA